jgi:pimeloyl-ACP methyl ester carboxylesterase
VARTTIEVDDPEAGPLTFDAVVDGDPSGPAVLLLHGFPETSASWNRQVPALVEAGYRVVAPDQRGYSPGARPTDQSAYRSERLVADVLAVADVLDIDRFHLVGHDWGGAVAWQVAGRHPERLRTLTVLSTPHPAAFRAARSGEGGSDQAERSGYMDFFREPGSEDVMLADDAGLLKLVYLGSGLTEQEAAPYLAALSTPEALCAALNWYRAADVGLVEGLGPIVTPTLYIWSTNDVALGREAAEATGRFVEGSYRFEELDGVDHWIGEHAPDAVNAVLLEHLAAS